MSDNGYKKNIMYIFNDTGFGGAGQSLLDTLSEIKDAVNPIVIVRSDSLVETQFLSMGMKCYKIRFSTDYVKIGSADEYKKMLDFKQSYEAAMQLIPIIQKEKVDLIHINSSTSYFAAIAAIMTHIPYIWHIRELMQEQFNCEFLNEDLRISLYKKADKLIAISDYVKAQYRKKYGLDTFRLYNGLNIGRFKKKESIEKSYTNTFIVAAMITPEKGQWDVIKAAELLIERGYTDVRIIIVGNGVIGYVWALKKYIKRKRLEKNICIFPFQDDLRQFRSMASYAITASQNEALGRVTIESMLAGNLVIGARSGGTTEIIGVNEERGFLYELGNSKSLADLMEKTINCAESEKNIILERAFEYAENTFDSRKYCKELIKIYDAVIETFRPINYEKFLKTMSEYYESLQDYGINESHDNFASYKKSTLMYHVVLKWLGLKQAGGSFKEYFEQENIHSIAIYGMGALGCRLYDELEGSGIQVRYLIDKNPNGMEKVLAFTELESDKLDVDAIVVTAIASEKNIIEWIKSMGYVNVIGLSTLIDECEVYMYRHYLHDI